MIVGILSDTHGRGRTAATAVAVLKAAGAEAFVLCGDVGDGAVLEALAGLRAWFVWGNTDDSGSRLADYARSLGLTPPGEVPLRLELAGKSLAVFHGHEPQFGRLIELANLGSTAGLSAALDGADYVLFGHTHVPYSGRIGRVRFLNPGALYRARVHSVATLDLHPDRVRFWQIGHEQEGPTPRLVELPWGQEMGKRVHA